MHTHKSTKFILFHMETVIKKKSRTWDEMTFNMYLGRNTYEHVNIWFTILPQTHEINLKDIMCLLISSLECLPCLQYAPLFSFRCTFPSCQRCRIAVENDQDPSYLAAAMVNYLWSYFSLKIISKGVFHVWKGCNSKQISIQRTLTNHEPRIHRKRNNIIRTCTGFLVQALVLERLCCSRFPFKCRMAGSWLPRTLSS